MGEEGGRGRGRFVEEGGAGSRSRGGVTGRGGGRRRGWLAPLVFVGVVGGWVWWWVMRRVTHDTTRGIYITIGDIVAREQVKDHTLSSTPLPPSALYLRLLTTQGSNRHIHSSTQRGKKTMKTVAVSLTSKK